MQKFGNILDLEWIYCDLDPLNVYLGKLKMEMRAWILGSFRSCAMTSIDTLLTMTRWIHNRDAVSMNLATW